MAETKQRIPADPNNLSWAQDDSGYGARLLSKMGWKRGTGLGKHEDGSVECIKLKARTESQGIGAETSDSRVAAWADHSQIYEQALKNLGDVAPINDKKRNKIEKQRNKKDKKRDKNDKPKKRDDEKEEKKAKSESPMVVKGHAVHRSRYIKNKRLDMYSKEALRQILGK